MLTPINRSDKCQKNKGKKEEVTSLGPPEQNKNLFILTSED